MPSSVAAATALLAAPEAAVLVGELGGGGGGAWSQQFSMRLAGSIASMLQAAALRALPALQVTSPEGSMLPVHLPTAQKVVPYAWISVAPSATRHPLSTEVM